MRRKAVLTGVWVVATLAATLVAWAAVRQVTDEVSPSRTLPFPSGVALADAATEDVLPPAATAAPTAAPPRPGRATDRPAAPASDPPEAAEQPPGDSEEEVEPAVAAPATTQAYTLTGGVVTVRYRGSRVTLVSATPNSGFGVDINDAGPDKVDVRFRAEEHESRLVTRVRDGAPDPQREERPR